MRAGTEPSGPLRPPWPVPSPLQFQGKWYVVGLAGNAVSKEDQGQFKMYTTNYELKEDGSYNVTSTLLRWEPPPPGSMGSLGGCVEEGLRERLMSRPRHDQSWQALSHPLLSTGLGALSPPSFLHRVST